MSGISKHTLTINISDRIEWIDKRCGLTEIQKDYITAQMKEAVSDAVHKANEANKQPDTKALRLQNVVPSTSLDVTKGIKSCSGCLHYHPSQYSGNCTVCKDFNKWQRS